MGKKRGSNKYQFMINHFLLVEGKSTKSVHSKGEIIGLLKQHYDFDAGTKATCDNHFKRFVDVYKVQGKKAPKPYVYKKPLTITKKIATDIDFYSSWEWKKVRYNVLLKYGRRCMCCGATPPDAVMVVDHIKPRKKYPELSLNIDNLQVLCNDCNMGKSNDNYTDFR